MTITKKTNRELQFYFCLAIVSLIIFTWLISPLFYPDVWKGYFQQIDPDSLLFARLLEQSILKNKILTVDNYAAFPYETKTGFAPFYMWFLYSFVNLVFYIFPNLSIDPIYIAGILPIIIPWFTILFLLISVYKISNNKILTLFCALGMLPGYSTAMVAGFMKLDYDFVISFFIWAWIVFGAFYIKTEKHSYVYAGAAITALFISTWTGAPFFYFFVCIYGLILWFNNPNGNSSYLSYSSISLLIGSIIAIIFVPRNEDTLRNFFSYDVSRYSYIHGILVLLGSVFLLLLNKLSFIKKPRIIGTILLFFFALIILVFFHETILQATGILFQKDPIHATIGELQIGFDYNRIFDGAIKDSILRFTPLILFLPICYLVRINIREEKGIKNLLHWFILFLLLSLFYQIRYIRWISVGYGLVLGFIIYYFWEILKNTLTKDQSKLSKLGICLLPIIIVSITINYTVISSQYKLPKEEVELYSWIKKETPTTSGYSDDEEAEYGILSYWDQGNKISFYTKRPAMVSNSMWGYKTMADIFSSECEKDSYALCQKYNNKYIVLNPSSYISKPIKKYWPMLKDKPETPEYKFYNGEIIPRDNFDYFYFWLADNLGLTPLGSFTTTEHFRIVFANKNDGNTISKYIMFERVEGAKIDLNLEPNSKVTLSLVFKLSEMSFVYKINKTTDEKGHCLIVLPYSNNYENGNILTDPFYKVSLEKDGKKRLAKLVVTDSDVIEGKAVNLDKQFEVIEQE